MKLYCFLKKELDQRNYHYGEKICNYKRKGKNISQRGRKKIYTDQIKEKLLKISAATVDRMLRKYSEKWELRKKYKGNPYSWNLKRSIQVESWFEKGKRTWMYRDRFSPS